eukprot:47629-Eustigmatos_ZCMA.PRE.1
MPLASARPHAEEELTTLQLTSTGCSPLQMCVDSLLCVHIGSCLAANNSTHPHGAVCLWGAWV